MKWLSFSVIALLSLPVCASQVEVLHWWTSGGEARAVEVLKSEWAEQGNQWNDFAVQGGRQERHDGAQEPGPGGKPAGGSPPQGVRAARVGQPGLSARSHPHGRAPRLVPSAAPMVRDTLSQNGALMAVPTGIHRVNWLWLNRKVFEQQGLKPPPTGPNSWRWRTSSRRRASPPRHR